GAERLLRPATSEHDRVDRLEEAWLDDYEDGGGDVKYHRGYSGTRRYPNGRMLHLAMASNPSHLEAVDPVVLGRCRAKQALRADSERSRVIPVLMHGDAAIVGQGVVAECLNFSELEGYTTGGTVHVVVNNQIGFTTIPEDGRSSRYCTDIGKAIDAPIFHVNGEDPEAVVSVARFAMEYRQEFQRDVFIDLQCYRKFGHNEQDEASFTQPLLVKRIKDKQSVLTMYAERLLAEQVINQADVHAIRLRLDEALNQAQKLVKESPHDPTIDPGSARWAGMTQEFEFGGPETGIGRETLAEICDALSKVPDGFNINRKLEKLLKQRGELKDGGELSHADAELLAFGSLLLEGHPIRLSGQDSRRGTFSQRHAVLRDSESGEPYIPINHMRDLGVLGTDAAPGSEGDDGRARQAKLSVLDSPLSEFGVLGFEYGYSLADPDGLVLWEAQFGDFVNGAQVIIDQFIASAEQKWERWSGLVMLLPHGYEGQGPEHSSARLERFLELCGASNVQVAYPSTGPQMFHLLRRQLKRGFRKPLVVMTPKSYLRVPTGTIDEVLAGSFREIFDDPRAGKEIDRKRVERIVLCSGKLYHELAERRDAREQWDTAIVRVEQLYPFPSDYYLAEIERYSNAEEIVWCQEEPQNQGAWYQIRHQLQAGLGPQHGLYYAGRPGSAAPASGYHHVHVEQQKNLVAAALGLGPE
ncbi:MAG: 2-oxoglutarate dehydrogenase E1 component, partial [Planctomycetota bacterium]